jgi:hypothetical protein
MNDASTVPTGGIVGQEPVRDNLYNNSSTTGMVDNSWALQPDISEVWSIILFSLVLLGVLSTILFLLKFLICGPSSYGIKRNAIAPCPLPVARAVEEDDDAYIFDQDILDLEIMPPFEPQEPPPPMIALADRVQQPPIMATAIIM